MSKYPVSCKGGKIDAFFKEVLFLHSEENSEIWDCTCGEKIMWQEYLATKSDNRLVQFSDIKDCGGNEILDYRTHLFNNKFDLVVFDPPYLFGVKAKDDPREDVYGRYDNTKDQLFEHIKSAPGILCGALKERGKVVLKCSDFYYVKEKTFYPLAYYWMSSFGVLFDLIDVFIYTGHRFSPTAFQVKDRGCSVNTHGYLLVFRRKP